MEEGGTGGPKVLLDSAKPLPTEMQATSGIREPIREFEGLQSCSQLPNKPENPAEPGDSAISVPKGGQPQTCPLCKKLLLGGGKVMRKHLRRVHRANVVSARPGPPNPKRNNISSGASRSNKRGAASLTDDNNLTPNLSGPPKSLRETLADLLQKQTGDDIYGCVVLPEEWIGHTVKGVIHSKFNHGYFVTVKLGSEQLSGILYHPPEGGLQGSKALRLLKEEQETDAEEKVQKRPRAEKESSAVNSGLKKSNPSVVANMETEAIDGNRNGEVGIRVGGENGMAAAVGGRERVGKGGDYYEFDGNGGNMVDEDVDAEDDALPVDHASAESEDPRLLQAYPVAVTAPPPKPKRTSFNFYYTEWRVLLKARHPDLPETDISKMIGEQWRKLTPEEKQPYVDLWKRDKERWEAEQLAYNAYRLQMAFS